MRFQNINHDFTEDEYLATQALIVIAAGLFGDGLGDELGDNPEYERGIIELILQDANLPTDHRDEVRAEIYQTARHLRLHAQNNAHTVALLRVQKALANFRDGEKVLVVHPKHGPIETLEEVKYLVVDEALSDIQEDG